MREKLINVRYLVVLFLAAAGLVIGVSCSNDTTTDESTTESVEGVGHAAAVGDTCWVTEVAQSTLYGGSTADKCEVYCEVASTDVRCCDGTAAGGENCSAAVSVGAGQYYVFSRGTQIAVTDKVWVKVGGIVKNGPEGPFNCTSGNSMNRCADNDNYAFSTCGTPALGTGSLCQATCGNSVVDRGELCDDGNTTSGDGCSSTCGAEYCGDGVTNNTSEACDDGVDNGTGDGKCLLDCSAVQTCGNGVTNGTEQCDTSGESSTCDSNCTLASCGDGDVNTTLSEACDDGNRLNGDGCTKTCTVDTRTAFCGETAGTYGDGSAGAAFTAQQIEDLLYWLNGATQAQIDACTYIDSTEAAALYAAKPFHAIGTIGSDEATGAQAGHIDSAAGISEAASDNDFVGLRNCVAATQTCSDVCGNGILNSGEQCDDGGQSSDCNSNCTLAGCGDGTVNTSSGESCDDGNTVSGDGCSGICKEEFSYEIWFAANYEAGTTDTTCNSGTRTMCADLMSLIRSAEHTIDFAIYGNSLDMNMVADALSDRQDDGVVVRGIVDVQDATFCNQSSACGGEGQPVCATYSYSKTQDFVNELASGTIMCDNGVGSGYIMHDKFFVIDGYKVWTGTTNVSRNCIGGEGNANTSILVNSWRVAKAYVEEVDQMWTSRVNHNEKTDKSAGLLENFADGSTAVKQYFAPKADVSNNAIIPAIAAAEKTIDVQMFYLTSQPIADALIDAYQRGVSVRMIIDAGGDVSAYDRTSCKTCDGNPNEAGYIDTSVEIGMDFLCSYLDEVGGANNPVMIVKTDPWGGKQHNKTAVIDAGLPGHGTVIIGSQNWSAAGEDSNDENTLYIKNDAVASDMQSDFNTKWNSTALQGVAACSYVAQEGNASSDCVDNKCDTACNFGSCCDANDNDMDGNVDAADNGCYNE